jgi:glutamate transport system substrate-binding protein
MQFQKIIGVGAAAFLTVTLAACGSGGSADSSAPAMGETTAPAAPVVFPAGTTMDRLAKAHQITVGTKYDMPMFGLQGLSGQPEGFDVEIAKIIASELGIPETAIIWGETPTEMREQVLEQKRVDMVVATYTIKDERRQRVTFAGPYYIGGQDLMVKTGNTTIIGPDSLKPLGAKVCATAGGSSGQNILKYVSRSHLMLLDGHTKCAEALRTGKADAITTDAEVLLGLSADNRGAFKVLNKPFAQKPWGVGIPKGDIPFCDFINQVLTKAAADGRYEAAWTRTAGAVMKTSARLPELDPCV